MFGKIVSRLEAYRYMNTYKNCLIATKNKIKLFKRSLEGDTFELRSFDSGNPLKTVRKKHTPDCEINSLYKKPYDSMEMFETNVINHRTGEEINMFRQINKVGKDGVFHYPYGQGGPCFKFVPESNVKFHRTPNGDYLIADTEKGKLLERRWYEPGNEKEQCEIFINGKKWENHKLF